MFLLKNKLDIALSVIIALFPALAVYNVLPGTTLATLLLWMCIIIFFLLRGNEVRFSQDETFFFFCIVLISCISILIHLVMGAEWFDCILAYHNLYSIAICLIPLCFVIKLINVKIFVKTVLVFGIVASFVLIWQWSMFLFTGSFQNNLFLPWFEIARDTSTISMLRPSAFFTEPAHFCIYMLPAFQIALCYDKKMLAILFAFAMLCSGSTTGMLLLIVLFVYHLCKIGSRKWYVSLIVAITVAVGIYALLFILPDFFDKNFDKLEKVNQGGSDVRLLGTLIYLSLLQSYELFFGITLNQLGNLLMMKHFSAYGYGNYANALIYMYISYGLVGLVSFVLYMARKFKLSKENYGFFIIFLGIVCSDQILFNAHYFYLLVFVVLTNEICKRRDDRPNQLKCFKMV